jgi:hypothetical protein
MLRPRARWVRWPDGEAALENGNGVTFPLAIEGWQQVFRKQLDLRPRSLCDLLGGRREFALDRLLSLSPIQFTAVRGSIVFQWVDDNDVSN